MTPRRPPPLPARLRARATALALAVLLPACAGLDASRPFERPGPNRFLPGATAASEVIAAYGAPGRERAWDAAAAPAGEAALHTPFGRERVEGRLREFEYVYVAPQAAAVRPGIEPTRTLYVWFWQDRLVGYLGQSSFRADATAFDESRVNALRVGTSTRRDLLGALGPPAGILTHPLVRGEGNEVLSWDSVEFDRFRNETRRKRLDVLVDAAGAVIDLRYASSLTPVAPPVPTILAPPTYTPPPVLR